MIEVDVAVVGAGPAGLAAAAVAAEAGAETIPATTRPPGTGGIARDTGTASGGADDAR